MGGCRLQPGTPKGRLCFPPPKFHEPQTYSLYQLRMKLGAGEVLVSPSPRASRLSCHIRCRLACNLSSTPGSLKPACVNVGNSCSRAPVASPDLPRLAEEPCNFDQTKMLCWLCMLVTSGSG